MPEAHTLDSTLPTSVAEESVVSTVSPENVAKEVSRLKQSRLVTLKLTDTTSLNCVVGMDPKKETSLSGWSCYFAPGQQLPPSVELYDDQDKQIFLSDYPGMFPEQTIRYLKIDGKEAGIWRDEWGNPYLTFYQEGKQEFAAGFDKAIEKSVRIWEAAIESESAVKSMIEQLYGAEVLSNIQGILSSIEQLPFLQQHIDWTRQADLVEIAHEAQGNVAKAKELLWGRNNSFAPPEIEATGLAQLCDRILEKLVTHRTLTKEEWRLIDTLKFTSIATRELAHTHLHRYLNEHTRKFAYANIAENLVCREIVPLDIFTQHQREFSQLQHILSEAGYEVPEWFASYRSTEFRWSIYQGYHEAYDIGDYFLSSGSTTEGITQTLNHERGHNIKTKASELGATAYFDARETSLMNILSEIRSLWQRETITQPAHRKSILSHTLVEIRSLLDQVLTYKQEPYEECFTEALSQLIHHQGSVTLAIQGNKENGTAYHTGVHEFLSILSEIELQADQPLLGVQLMIDGLKNVAAGTTNAQSEVVKKKYDQLKGEGAFAKRMDPFKNALMINLRWTDLQEKEKPSFIFLQKHISKSVSAIRYRDLSPDERKMYLNSSLLFSLEKRREASVYKDDPATLLNISNSPLRGRVLAQIESDPQASAEFTAYVTARYELYVDALRAQLPEEEREEPTASLAAPG